MTGGFEPISLDDMRLADLALCRHLPYRLIVDDAPDGWLTIVQTVTDVLGPESAQYTDGFAYLRAPVEWVWFDCEGAGLTYIYLSSEENVAAVVLALGQGELDPEYPPVGAGG